MMLLLAPAGQSVSKYIWYRSSAATTSLRGGFRELVKPKTVRCISTTSAARRTVRKFDHFSKPPRCSAPSFRCMEKQMEFSLQSTSFPTITPHVRAYSRNHSSLASLSSEYARHKPSGNALKTAGCLLVAVGLALSLNTSSADNQKEELDQHSQFAKSVEELETEERRLHGNVIIRWLYVVGDALHYYIIEPLGTTKRFIVLVLLFAPVILTMPMLLVGRRREGGRRRGRRVPKTEGGQRVLLERDRCQPTSPNERRSCHEHCVPM